MQSTSIEQQPTRRLSLDVSSIRLTDDEFYQLCRDNPELRIELTARGELVLMSPAGAKTGHRESRLNQRLANWAETDGTGMSFSSSAGFTLPNGSKQSPDAAWIRRSRWDALGDDEQERFAPICPDFVVELRSPSDRLPELQEKMVEYIENGARLGWLLDPLSSRAYIYRPGLAAELLENPGEISGEEVLVGFNLDFRELG